MFASLMLAGSVSLPVASTSAQNFEELFHFIMKVGIITFVLVVGTACIFAWKYRRKGSEIGSTPYIPTNFFVEFGSIFVTSIVVAIFFIWGWRDYKYMISPKMDEYEINVMGQQWLWQVQYANGITLTNEMYVPRGRPVKMIVGSKDVLHSFYIPAFRHKIDAVPGLYTTLHVTPTQTGTFDIFCAEYCGTSHSGMIGKLHVLEPDQFDQWLAGVYKPQATVAAATAGGAAAGEAKPLSMAEKGAALYRTKTCIACHTVDGNRLVGPSFKGLFGSSVDLMSGEKVTADENYLRESMMDPMKKVVKGYPPSMPTFRGMLSDEDATHLIAYIKSLK